MATQIVKDLFVYALAVGVVFIAGYLILYKKGDTMARAHKPEHKKGGVPVPAGKLHPDMEKHCPVLYKASFCGWCKKLIEEMGDAYFLIVETTEDPAAAQAAGVGGIPDVRYNGKKAVGYGNDAKSLLQSGTHDGLTEAMKFL